MDELWSTDYHTIGFFEAFSSAYQAFGLPSTIRTCDLRLRRAQAYFLQASLYGRTRPVRSLQMGCFEWLLLSWKLPDAKL